MFQTQRTAMCKGPETRGSMGTPWSEGRPVVMQRHFCCILFSQASQSPIQVHGKKNQTPPLDGEWQGEEKRAKESVGRVDLEVYEGTRTRKTISFRLLLTTTQRKEYILHCNLIHMHTHSIKISFTKQELPSLRTMQSTIVYSIFVCISHN